MKISRSDEKAEQVAALFIGIAKNGFSVGPVHIYYASEDLASIVEAMRSSMARELRIAYEAGKRDR